MFRLCKQSKFHTATDGRKRQQSQRLHNRTTFPQAALWVTEPPVAPATGDCLPLPASLCSLPCPTPITPPQETGHPSCQLRFAPFHPVLSPTEEDAARTPHPTSDHLSLPLHPSHTTHHFYNLFTHPLSL